MTVSVLIRVFLLFTALLCLFAAVASGQRNTAIHYLPGGVTNYLPDPWQLAVYSSPRTLSIPRLRTRWNNARGRSEGEEESAPLGSDATEESPSDLAESSLDPFFIGPPWIAAVRPSSEGEEFGAALGRVATEERNPVIWVCDPVSGCHNANDVGGLPTSMTGGDPLSTPSWDEILQEWVSGN